MLPIAFYFVFNMLIMGAPKTMHTAHSNHAEAKEINLNTISISLHLNKKPAQTEMLREKETPPNESAFTKEQPVVLEDWMMSPKKWN